MDRLRNIECVIYDSNIIIYQCFPNEKYRIIELTKLARGLTRFLFNQNTSIVVPKFIIREIEQKGMLAIIDDYFNDKNIHMIFEPPKNVDEAFKFKLYRKLRTNYNKLKHNEKFIVEDYTPSKVLINDINSAFYDFNNLDNIESYLNRKHVDYVNPSDEDKMLILFSKEKNCPVISNDLDFTFFHDELLKRELVFEIIDFTSISFKNCN